MTPSSSKHAICKFHQHVEFEPIEDWYQQGLITLTKGEQEQHYGKGVVATKTIMLNQESHKQIVGYINDTNSICQYINHTAPGLANCFVINGRVQQLAKIHEGDALLIAYGVDYWALELTGIRIQEWLRFSKCKYLWEAMHTRVTDYDELIKLLAGFKSQASKTGPLQPVLQVIHNYLQYHVILHSCWYIFLRDNNPILDSYKRHGIHFPTGFILPEHHNHDHKQALELYGTSTEFFGLSNQERQAQRSKTSDMPLFYQELYRPATSTSSSSHQQKALPSTGSSSSSSLPHKPLKNQTNRNKQVVCLKCDKVFGYQKNLEKHKRQPGDCRISAYRNKIALVRAKTSGQVTDLTKNEMVDDDQAQQQQQQPQEVLCKPPKPLSQYMIKKRKKEQELAQAKKRRIEALQRDKESFHADVQSAQNEMQYAPEISPPVAAISTSYAEKVLLAAKAVSDVMAFGPSHNTRSKGH